MKTIISDNGPQYSAFEFAEFAKLYGINHKTSSPKYPRENGEAERAVQTITGLLAKNSDSYLALLSYKLRNNQQLSSAALTHHAHI